MALQSSTALPRRWQRVLGCVGGGGSSRSFRHGGGNGVGGKGSSLSAGTQRRLHPGVRSCEGVSKAGEWHSRARY